MTVASTLINRFPVQDRQYQFDFEAGIENAWERGARYVVGVLPTGGGKTVSLSRLVAKNNGASAVIAHRQEIVSQLSIALARNGVMHNLIAAQNTRRGIAAVHLDMFGRSFYNPQSRVAVASVDTLARAKNLDHWFPQVTRLVVDEGHHVVTGNKWDTALKKFTNANLRGLLPTATPERADGKGLGAHADGVANAMVEGPSMRWLIEQGYLTDYDVVLAKSDLDLLEADVGTTGDYSPAKLKAAAKKSHIVGDMVTAYLTHAHGLRGIVFVTDVDTANETAARFRAAGVRAEALTGETDDGYRRQILRRLERGDLDVLVAVDIVSEGFDLPAVHVGQFGRPTESLGLYMQQFGRFLRPRYAPGYDLTTQAGRLAAIAAGPKPRALCIDHVGNFHRHGPPDKPRVWSLDGRERRSKGGAAIPSRSCMSCFETYERFRLKCPWCGAAAPPPEARGGPAQVEGDLVMMDRETLDALRGAMTAANITVDEYKVWATAQRIPPEGFNQSVRRHAERLEALEELRGALGRFGGPRHAAGQSDREIQREVWARFGVDVLTAMSLPRPDAQALTGKINAYLEGN